MQVRTKQPAAGGRPRKFDKAEALASKNEDKLFIYYFRGSIAEREKLYDEADAQFQKGLAIDPNLAVLWRSLATRETLLPYAGEAGYAE